MMMEEEEEAVRGSARKIEGEKKNTVQIVDFNISQDTEFGISGNIQASFGKSTGGKTPDSPYVEVAVPSKRCVVCRVTVS